jgi:hypothetical protein
LEDHVEELRDAASLVSTTNHSHHSRHSHHHPLKSNNTMVATTGITNRQYQEAKTHLIQKHNREVALLRAEVEKLNCRNDALERHAAVRRFATAGDADSNAVETNDVDFWEEEFPSRRWSVAAEGTDTSVEAPQSATKAPSRGHALTEENSNPSPSS